MIGVILTIASVLFGFLAGFVISELWTRYTEIRSLQGVRSSNALNMIRYASYFYSDKIFEKNFKYLVEKAAVADEIIAWDEGHLEIKYFQAIEDSFHRIKIKNPKDEVYFDNLLDSYHNVVEGSVRLDTLYKERLFPSQWLLLIGLSLIIAFSTLFLDITDFFPKVVVIAFPLIIVIALSIIYDLDSLNWGKAIITLEPNQILFDAIGAKRFYQTINVPYLSSKIIGYRTERTLSRDLMIIYNSIFQTRKNRKPY